jgi:hypothetical protein
MQESSCSENKLLSSYEEVLESFRKTLESYSALQEKNAGIQAENEMLGRQVEYERGKEEELIQQFETTKNSLVNNNNQLSALYLGIVNDQFSLASSNAKLCRDVDILRSLNSNVNASPFIVNDFENEIKFTDRVFQNVKSKIALETESENKILVDSIQYNAEANQVFNKNLSELVENQSENFRNKLRSVMDMSESLVTNLSSKNNKNEDPFLGKRDSLTSSSPKFDGDKLKSKNERLLNENKFLLYVIESFQKRFTEANVAIPENLLKTEFLLKNRDFLTKTDSPLYANIKELSERNHMLSEELQLYKQSSYLKNCSANRGYSIQCLQSLKNEFQIIIETNKLDQEFEIFKMIDILYDRIKNQEGQISTLHQTVANNHASNKAQAVEILLLNEKLDLYHDKIKNLEVFIHQIQSEAEVFRKNIEEKVLFNNLKPSQEMQSVQSFFDKTMESTALLFNLIKRSRDSTLSSDSLQPCFVNQLFERLNEDAKNLRVNLELVQNENIELKHDNFLHLEKILNLENELKKTDAQEMIKELTCEVSDLTAQLNDIKKEFEDSHESFKNKINAIEDENQNKISELNFLKIKMQSDFDLEIANSKKLMDDFIQSIQVERRIEQEATNSVIEAKEALIKDQSDKINQLESYIEKITNDFNEKYSKDLLELQNRIFQLESDNLDLKQKHGDTIIRLTSENHQNMLILEQNHQTSLKLKSTENEAFLLELSKKIKYLEHSNQIMHYSRDNLFGIIEHSYANIEIPHDHTHTENGEELIDKEAKQTTSPFIAVQQG